MYVWYVLKFVPLCPNDEDLFVWNWQCFQRKVADTNVVVQSSRDKGQEFVFGILSKFGLDDLWTRSSIAWCLMNSCPVRRVIFALDFDARFDTSLPDATLWNKVKYMRTMIRWYGLDRWCFCATRNSVHDYSTLQDRTIS